ncbi:Ubiquitin-like-conjugating enzyme ATG10 [Cardamine amara subsp. amara]|uniref:Ubiquitin-like-conjugating enzyme ATG10 n=1 Tax=Cardamine amara subsp. amara TaxID=228776 RepID=A0ABD1AZ30_CARAN
MESGREVSDFSSGDGRLTVEDFSVAARGFSDNWKTHNQSFPPWSWVPLISRTPLVSKKEEGYLSLEKIIILSSLEEKNPEEDSLNVETDCSEKEESIDDTILVQPLDNEAHYYDFHIVYSASYRVPVLYFRGYCSGGKPLSLDVIKKDLPSCSVSLLMESKWTFITQEEHPYLNRPWFKLHPCGTEEWIKLLSQSSSSAGCQMPVELYLVSWFSVVGQVVGLRIPLEMLN